MRTPLTACMTLLMLAGLALGDLDKARETWLRGRYAEAEDQYQKLERDEKTRAAAAVGLSKAYASQGKYDKAMDAVEKGLKLAPADAGLLARQAELLHFRGRWDEAEKAAAAALAADKKNLLARWVRLQVHRDRGDSKKAEAEARAIVREYDPDAKQDADDLLITGLASAENARWNGLADEFTTILQDLFGDAVKQDKSFWPAEYHSGMLLLEKYNRGEALAAFDNALKINASCAEALTARGVAELQRMEFQEAEKFAERALKHNPNLPDALRLRADVFWATGDVASAKRELGLARRISPRDERVLARLAACEHVAGEKKEFDALVAEVEKFDAKPALFYYDLGERLEERKRYDQAEKHFKKAAELRPNMPGPLNSLGLLYMRTGDEEAARPLLEKGFKADPFNVRVKNMRTVIRHLDKYKTIKTKHFVVRYDEDNDGKLGPYVADQLEGLYDELAKQFSYQPEGPILIEIFRTHDMFSGRTVALPDLHTIGACTGRVVTMASPKAKGVGRPFNWMRVMRHELVHVFNLEQTNYMVPHWFTEGLAVNNEGFPRQPAWNQMLVERYQADQLLNLDTIDLAFIRPRDGAQWQQAYLQAQLYVEFIAKTYGQDSIGKMLTEFGKGKGAAEAIAAVCKADREAFEKGYRGYVGGVVKTIKGPKAVQKRRTLAELQKANKADPEDADVNAELAVRLLPTAKRADARKHAEAALAKKADHPKALYVLAMLERRADNQKKAMELLEKALDKDDPDPLVAKTLGKFYYDAKEYDKAANAFEAGRKADPFDKDYLVELARVYAQKDDAVKQAGILKELVPLDADDLDRRVRLAGLLLASGKPDEAEKYAREALHIDVTNRDAREHLFASLRGQKKEEELNKARKLLEP